MWMLSGKGYEIGFDNQADWLLNRVPRTQRQSYSNLDAINSDSDTRAHRCDRRGEEEAELYSQDEASVRERAGRSRARGCMLVCHELPGEVLRTGVRVTLAGMAGFPVQKKE